MTRAEAWRVYADVLGCEPASLATVLVAVANKADPLDVALRRMERGARADYRAGRISLAECRAVTRAVRETIGGE